MTTERWAGLTLYPVRTIVVMRQRLATLRASALPAIVQFPGHFVVVDSITTADSVILRDPAIGRIRMTVGVFERAWTGRVLLVREAAPIALTRP